MSEVKKIATRDSYGNALVELGKAHDDLIVLDAQEIPSGIYRSLWHLPGQHQVQ